MAPYDNTDSVINANTRCVKPIGNNRNVPKSGETSDFWRRLAHARERKGLSMDQKVIAKEYSVWQSAVTKWKTGKSLPKLETAREMAITAGVCVDWLLTERQPELPAGEYDPELSRLMRFWSTMSQDIKKSVVDYAVFRRLPGTVSIELERLTKRREGKNADDKPKPDS